MKLHQLIIAILLTGLLGCQTKQNEIKIKGQISGEIPEKVEYTLPINGVCNYAFKESVKPDSSGNFAITLTVEKPSFIKIFIPRKAYGTLLVEKGMTYNIKFDLNSNGIKFNVTDKSRKGQTFLNSLPNPGHIQSGVRQFSKDSIASEIKEKINRLKEDELIKFKELVLNGDISEDFYKLVKLDRECYYSAIQGTIALLKKHEDVRKNNGAFLPEIKKMWQESFIKSSPTTNTLLCSPWYCSLAKNFINYNEYTESSFNIDKLREIYQNGLINTHNIEESKKHLTSDALEYYDATYLFHACLQKNYEKELITLFEDFRSDFPNSQYSKFIEPMVTPIVEYHKKKEEPFNENIKFIEEYEKKNSLDEAVSSLKGKKIYIDVWATWCGPCKAEFAHKSELKKLLVENNTEILYISIDRDENDTKWKDMIKFYNLEGYHIRTNKALDSNLRKVFGQNGSISIPWYILIDENGKIIKTHASRPSQIKELAKELNIKQKQRAVI